MIPLNFLMNVASDMFYYEQGIQLVKLYMNKV